MAQLRHPNRSAGHFIGRGQCTVLQSISNAATYHAPTPRTVLIRVKGKLPPFSTALQCHWMNGHGKPYVYSRVEVL